MNTKFSYETDTAGDLVYLNISSTNFLLDPVQAIIDVSRATPLLKNPSDYQCSIVRFKIPTTAGSLFNFIDITDGVYSVTMEIAAVSVTVDLLYADTGNSIPNNTFPIFYYQTFVDMVNAALETAFSMIPVPSRPVGSFFPYMIYNKDEQSFSIIADGTWEDQPPFISPAVIRLYFSQALYNKFNNFITQDTIPPSVPGSTRVVIQNTFNNRVLTIHEAGAPLAPVPGFEMRQEYSTVSLLNSLDSIVIASNNLPVNSEDIIINSLAGSSGITTQTLNIINDFQPLIQEAGSQMSIQYYQPSIFRYVSMYSTNLLYSFGLQFYTFSADTNTYQPLFIPYRQSISLKILFKRRRLNF